MNRPVPKPVVFDVPLGPVEDSQLHDKDAEDVIQFADDEKRAEEEQAGMASEDPLTLALREKLGRSCRRVGGKTGWRC